jgi:hypothetical protein
MDIMIDLETLAASPDAVILTIAAQCFDPLGKGYSEKFQYYARITLDSQEDRVISDSTVEWWGTQPEAAAEALAEDNRIPLEQALDELHKLCWKCDLIWTNGITFDICILENAYTKLGKPLPWQFFKVRDARTVYSLWPDCPKPVTSHHALEDCRRQIDILQQTLIHLNVKKLK